VRESDQILVAGKAETGRLQNLIHRYINQPSPGIVRRDPAGCAKAVARHAQQPGHRTDPDAGRESVEELEACHRALLSGFGELRSAADDDFENLRRPGFERRPGTWPGLYSIIEGATRPTRDARDLAHRWENPARRLPRCWSPPMPYYLSLAFGIRPREAAATPRDHRTNHSRVMIDLADNDLQRIALQRLNGPHHGRCARASPNCRSKAGQPPPTWLAATPSTARQADTIGAIDGLSVQDAASRERSMPQATFDKTLADISRQDAFDPR